MRTVKQIVHGHTTSGRPYAYALLDCEHERRVEFKPDEGECRDCGAHVVGIPRTGRHGTGGFRFEPCRCGSRTFKVTYSAWQERDEDIVTQVGDQVECRTCVSHAKALERLRDLDLSNVSHTRFKPMYGGGVGTIYMYEYDKTSPTGVKLYASFPATKEIEALMSKRGSQESQRGAMSPLSPTEAR